MTTGWINPRGPEPDFEAVGAAVSRRVLTAVFLIIRREVERKRGGGALKRIYLRKSPEPA
jgi:hypothetical protein